MKYDELILISIECIKKFNSSIEGPDSYVDSYLKGKTKDSNERMFIKQIFYGTLRYSEFLKIFTEKLFNMNKGSTERKDETLFNIFAYITIFRLDELPLSDYKQLIYSQDSVKMNEFFKFLFNPDILDNVLRPEWLTLYEESYVDSKLISSLNKNKELLSDMLFNVMNKSQGGNITRDISIKLPIGSDINPSLKRAVNIVTIQEPFNLTQPKPKQLQAPIQISNKVIPAKPIPYDEFRKVSLEQLETKRKERLELIKENLLKKNNEIKPFSMETRKGPSNIDKISEMVNKKIESELQFNNKYSNPVQDFSLKQANVKYNETAILREEYLIQKKKKQEEEELQKILIEKKDNKEFDRWKREMEERDNLLKLEEIQKRKLELELNREVAVDYYNQRILQNKLMVAKHKEEEQTKMLEKQIEMQIELEKNKKLVKEIERDRENLVEEKEKLVQKNKELFAQQISEYKDSVLKAKEEKRIEDERKKEIIRQIRELEKIPIKRTKGFDPTETFGHGILEEMSLVELRERLDQQRRFTDEFLTAKREENKLKLEEKNETLLEKANIISEHREKLRNFNENERKKKKDTKEQKETMHKEIKEKSLFEVKNKIEKKKEKIKREEKEFQQKIREIKLQQQFLQQGKSVLEEKAMKQIEDGLERKINNKQNRDLMDQQIKESIKWGEISTRFASAKKEVQQKENLMKNYEKTFKELKDINSNYLEEDMDYKKSLKKKIKGETDLIKTKIKENSKINYTNIKISNRDVDTTIETKSRIRSGRMARGEASLSPQSDKSRENHILQKLEKEMA